MGKNVTIRKGREIWITYDYVVCLIAIRNKNFALQSIILY